jgi:DNA invertase Pin-like site-specific DNA recombinase
MQTVALYIRVSTEEQIEYSPDAQKRLLLEFAKKNNMLTSNEYIFIDEGISGRNAEKRPEFQKMIALAKSKEHPFDTILVWKFSRFARNQEESIVYKSLLKKNNIDVISISEPLVDGPFGSLIERIIEWMDEYYSIRLSGEVKRGMTEKAMRGEYQTVAPFGYTMREGKLYPDEKKAEIIRNIFNMYLFQAESFFSIARILNEMGFLTNRGNKFENRTIKYIIENPVYKGFVRWNPNGKIDLCDQKYHSSNFIIKKGDHEPIISEDIWKEANNKIQAKHTSKHSRPSSILSHWLGGLLKCSNCESVLVSTGSCGGFQCNSYSKGKCNTSHFVSYKKIEQSVLDAFSGIVKTGNFNYEILSVDSIKENTDLLENKLTKIGQKEKRIKEAYINGVDSLEEYKSNKLKIEEDRLELENQLRNSKKIKKSKETNDIMLNRAKNIYSILLSDADKSLKNYAIKSIVKKIVYTKKTENIDIYLYYS